LFEDTAALLGLLVALIALTLSEHLNLPVLDSVASLIISLILAVTAGLLAFECKGLLTGEGASEEVVTGIKQIINESQGIKHVNEVLTLHLGPEDVLLNVSLDFEDDLSSGEVEEAISNLESRIKQMFPEIRRVFIEAQGWGAHRRESNRQSKV
jgi:divalent metal cation (Fe/Co/Zn/Cd) transporter